MELSRNEKTLLLALSERKAATDEDLAMELGAFRESVVQWGHLLAERGLAAIERDVQTSVRLTAEGREYAEHGLPERQVYESFGQSIPITELQSHPLSRIAIGWMRKKGWVTIREGVVEKTGEAPPGPDELALQNPEAGGEGTARLIERGLAGTEETVVHRLTITREGEALVEAGLDLAEEVGTLTRDLIITGGWRDVSLRRYRVDLRPRRIYPGKIHPYQALLGRMRRILLEMGFEEMYGGIVESSFWNFDALFQPQDHPAREMQDTFFLDETAPLPEGWERVAAMHEHGGETSSSGWGGRWSEEKARECVLRTHTTSLSIQHLVQNPDPPVKAFAIGRVYRREATDPTHLPEFEQLEGIVMDEGVGFAHLLGFLKEFYSRMGFSEVRFRPGYFPYTEPSVEPEVHVDGLGWVELGGAGIFREEVTAPWGIEHPVLAWGLGVSRLAMLTMDLADLRHLYRSDVDWVRQTPSVPGGR